MQYYNTKYVSSNYSLPLYVSIGQPYGANACFLTINFDNKDFTIPVYNIGVTNWQKIFIINGKQYSSIAIVADNSNTDSVYFSKDYGVVRIVSKGNQWNIIQ